MLATQSQHTDQDAYVCAEWFLEQYVQMSDDFYRFFQTAYAWSRYVLEKSTTYICLNILFPWEKIHLARLIGTVYGLCMAHKTNPAVLNMQLQKNRKHVVAYKTIRAAY